MSDLTSMPTKFGWLDLAAIIDLYSRKVIGWSTDVILSALEVALGRRNVEEETGASAGQKEARAYIFEYNKASRCRV